MTTFERLYIADPAAQVEIKDPYYRHIADPRTAEHILREFGLSGEGSHIVNGHVPSAPSRGKAPSRAADGSSLLTAASAVPTTGAPA